MRGLVKRSNLVPKQGRGLTKNLCAFDVTPLLSVQELLSIPVGEIETFSLLSIFKLQLQFR